MSISSRLKAWLRRLTPQKAPEKLSGLLREFVYLDEVSVYSILASRKGAIATEFTESQTASLNSDVGGSVSVGFGGTKAEIDSKMRAGHVQGSQVLRKAIIQTSFKELYDIERASLAFSPPDAHSMPTVKAVADIDQTFESLAKDNWITDPSVIRRGELLEVEVELEADPIFRMASVITTLRELMEDNEELFGHAITTQLPQMRSMAQVLEGFLVGLVPIRGRLVDYISASIGGRDVLIHRSLLKQIDPSMWPETHTAFVVGVAERDLFWKDIRRVLFAKARYTVFCRLATEGLAKIWHPVKVADVLAGIVPQFDEMIREFSEEARRAMTTAYAASPSPTVQHGRNDSQVLEKYVSLLATHHCEALTPAAIDSLIQGISLTEDWLSSVDSRRPIFSEVTRRVDAALGVESSSEVTYELRVAAVAKAGLEGPHLPQMSSGDGQDQSPGFGPERFLDAEIVAIYW